MAAQMGLLPAEWWAMTPREFAFHAEGYRKGTEYEMERLAWHAANIINHMPYFGKGRRKAVTPAELLGEKKPVVTNEQEFRAQLQARYEEREQEMGW